MITHGIYALTDEHLIPDQLLVSAVERALAAGVAAVQYRNKSASSSLRREQASSLLALCARYTVPLLINDDVALCAEIGAQGVHLGQQDCSLTEARKTLGENAIIGITCHDSLNLALLAAEGGADYVAFGRFFSSGTKPTAPAADPDILGQAKKRLDIPVVAIGGINADNGGSLLDAGADVLAVVGGIFSNDDIEGNVHSLTELFSSRQEAL